MVRQLFIIISINGVSLNEPDYHRHYSFKV